MLFITFLDWNRIELLAGTFSQPKLGCFIPVLAGLPLAQPRLAATFEIGWQPRYQTTILFLSLAPPQIKFRHFWQWLPHHLIAFFHLCLCPCVPICVCPYETNFCAMLCDIVC